jgi:rhodanese-related sulfurtransferase
MPEEKVMHAKLRLAAYDRSGVGSAPAEDPTVQRSPASDKDAPTTVEQLLAAARSRLQRLTPDQAHKAMRHHQAQLIDIRSDHQRSTDGVIPGAHFIARNVLEWRLDPACEHCDPLLARAGTPLVLICDEGYQSSLAAATVQRFGHRTVTDVIGGFRAWQAAGLPVQHDAQQGEPA